MSEEVLAGFTAETGIGVEVLRGGDAGTMLNQAILTKDNPIADVLFGVDNTFLARALDEEIFEKYEPSGLDDVPGELKEGTESRVAPVDFGDVCLNYDKEAFAASAVTVPETLDDLLEPDYRGMLVVEDPATSSPGLAFLLATIDRFGEQQWRGFWEGLRANDVEVTSGWEEAYYGSFSGGSAEGDRPLVVSYASSPPAEVIFAPEPITEAPTGVVLDGCFRQVEYVGILDGTEARDEAEQLVDFMLSIPFQEDIPLNMFVFPANEQAELPVEFIEHTEIPSDPATLDPAMIAANRDRWIKEWAEIVLQ